MDCVCSFHYARKRLSMETIKKTKEIRKQKTTQKIERENWKKENQLFPTLVKLLPWNLYFSLAGADVKYNNKKGNENKRNRDLRWQYITPWLVDKYIYVKVDKLLTKHATKTISVFDI